MIQTAEIHPGAASGTPWSIEESIAKGKKYCGRILHKHTDLISSCGILAITTCLLASQVFQTIPRILPRLAKVVYDFGGIIWLNVQLRDLAKSSKDLIRTVKRKEVLGFIEVAAKVFVKGVGIIMTCVIFAGSVAAAVGFSKVPLSLALAIRPLGLACLGINIATDIRDYSQNERLLKQFSAYEKTSEYGELADRLALAFLTIILQNRLSLDLLESTAFADLVVRQLDTQTIETCQEIFPKDQKKGTLEESLKIVDTLKKGIQFKQSGTKTNLSLIVLGYISMGLCRAFPNGLIDMTTRWSMSVLYTDELIRHKLFQMDLNPTCAL